MRKLAVAAGAVALMAVGGVAFAQATGDERIYACVNNGDGAIRQVAGATTACAKGWHKLSWSSENPPASPIPKTTTYSKFETIQIGPDDDLGFAIVDCDGDDVATGGGYKLGSPNTQSVDTNEPEIDFFSGGTTPTGWRVILQEAAPPGAAVAYAVCHHTE
jgi:hypothetical protein